MKRKRYEVRFEIEIPDGVLGTDAELESFLEFEYCLNGEIDSDNPFFLFVGDIVTVPFSLGWKAV